MLLFAHLTLRLLAHLTLRLATGPSHTQATAGPSHSEATDLSHTQASAGPSHTQATAGPFLTRRLLLAHLTLLRLLLAHLTLSYWHIANSGYCWPISHSGY